MSDEADMSFWFPKLLASGVPVPRTEIVHTDVPLAALLDGKIPTGFRDFVGDLEAAALKVGGFPLFLRTGHGSGKHDWARTCLVADVGDLSRHVAALVNWSECVDFLGLPYRTWAVRQLLAGPAAFTAFRGLPMRRERRYFVAGGQVLCHHPYWPEDSIHSPSREDWRPLLGDLNREAEEVEGLTARSAHVSRHFTGSWSLDWMESCGEWFAIDMAPAAGSFHWPGCPQKRAE